MRPTFFQRARGGGRAAAAEIWHYAAQRPPCSASTQKAKCARPRSATSRKGPFSAVARHGNQSRLVVTFHNLVRGGACASFCCSAWQLYYVPIEMAARIGLWCYVQLSGEGRLARS